MKRSKKEVAAAVERIEAVACTTIGDEPREVTLRPNDLRRLVDGLDDAAERDARQRAEIRALRKFALHIEQQLHSFGPRPNGIDQKYCTELGLMAGAALAPKRKARK